MPRRDYTSDEIRIALTAFASENGRKRPTEKLLREAKIKVPYDTIRGWAYRTHSETYQQIELEVEKDKRTRLADDWGRLSRMSTELAEDVLGRAAALFEQKDRELAEVEERRQDAEGRLAELDARIDSEQRAFAEALEIPDADALIEDILGDPGEIELDKISAARLSANYRRRERLDAEVQALWRRRDGLEVGFKDLAKILHEAGWTGAVATDKLNALTGNATERVEHSFPELQRALEAKGIRLTAGQGAVPRRLPDVEVKALPVAADG